MSFSQRIRCVITNRFFMNWLLFVSPQAIIRAAVCEVNVAIENGRKIYAVCGHVATLTSLLMAPPLYSFRFLLKID